MEKGYSDLFGLSDAYFLSKTIFKISCCDLNPLFKLVSGSHLSRWNFMEYGSETTVRYCGEGVTCSIHSLNHFNWQSQTNSFLQNSTVICSSAIFEKRPLGSLVSLFSDKRIVCKRFAPLQNKPPLLHLKYRNFSKNTSRT